jgi:hypothetical protein
MTVSTDVPVRAGDNLASVVDETRVVVMKPGSATSFPASDGVRLEPAAPQACSTATHAPANLGGPQAGCRYVDVVTDLEVLCTCTGRLALTYDGRPMQLVSATSRTDRHRPRWSSL